MAVSRALRRLLRIRELEEEQARVALESALSDLHRLEQAQASALAQDRRGRRLLESSVRSGEIGDRQAGLAEIESGGRRARTIAPMLTDAQQEVGGLRAEFLAQRVERRQAETLIEEAEARDALDGERRSQQGLDDWFRNRLHGKTQQSAREERGASETEQKDRSGTGRQADRKDWSAV
jgi:hypothetical protein